MARDTNNYAALKIDRKDRAEQTWYQTDSREMEAFVGINLIMGIDCKPTYKCYWPNDPFLSNQGIKGLMTCKTYEKLNEYFHVSDRSSEPARDSPQYDPLFKVRSIMESAKDDISSCYNPHREVSIDEGMIKWNGRLSYTQYMPMKPIKRGINVWMRCDATNGYLNDFNVYLGKKGTVPTGNGLGHDVVSELCSPLTGKYHHVYFDNYFSSVKLSEDLLAGGLYSCATVRTNRKGFPGNIKNVKKLKRGEYKIRQRGDLTATIWEDNKSVNVISTLSGPTHVHQVNRRSGREILTVSQPDSLYQYNKYMNGVDRHDQLRSCYDLGRDVKKAWKYLFWFVVNSCIVNAFILFRETSTRLNSKKNLSHLDFRMELGHALISDFSSRKRKSGADVAVPLQRSRFCGHHSVKMDTRARCKVRAKNDTRKTTWFGCEMCHVHLCRDGCHASYHASMPAQVVTTHLSE